jgi:hypothetical protein
VGWSDGSLYTILTSSGSSIVGNALLKDMVFLLGYIGTSGDATAYVVNPYPPENAVYDGNNPSFPISKSGTADSPIVFSGGWSTSSDTQVGETVLSARNNYGIFGSGGSMPNVTFDRFSFVRATYTVRNGTTNVAAPLVDSYMAVCCSYPCDDYSNNSFTMERKIRFIVQCYYGTAASTVHTGTLYCDGMYMCALIYFAGGTYKSYTAGVAIRVSSSLGQNQVATILNSNNNVNKFLFEYNGASTAFYVAPHSAPNFLEGTNNCASDFAQHATYSSLHQGVTYWKNYDGVAGDNRGHNFTFKYYQQSSVARTGLAYRIALDGTYCRNTQKGKIPIALIDCSANNQVTFTAYIRKSHATNVEAGLFCAGRQITGVDSDVTSYMTDTADTWEQVTLQFTPTEEGVVEIHFIAFLKNGSTTLTYNAYCDDWDFSQV